MDTSKTSQPEARTTEEDDELAIVSVTNFTVRTDYGLFI